MDDFQKAITRRRRETGLSIQQIAELAGISRQQVHAIFRGGPDVKLQTAERIGAALGLQLRWVKSCRK